jgi:hypothetical protein
MKRQQARPSWWSLFGSKLASLYLEAIDENDDEAVYYDEFFKRLRDGKCTLHDYERIRKTCSDHSLTPGQWRRRGFLEDGVTALFSTNKEVNEDNVSRLVKLGNPIARIEARNSCGQKSSQRRWEIIQCFCKDNWKIRESKKSELTPTRI